MPNLHELENAMPIAPLGVIALSSMKEAGDRINEYLIQYRTNAHHAFKDDSIFEGYLRDNYLINHVTPRFGSGEGKAHVKGSVRGKDLYILVDVMNHSLTYKMNGYENHMSPDDHYQDLKRVIAACSGHAHRINVIMPFMYESRQHARSGIESLDCAYALEELHEMGVSNIITFDAHDPRVQNSIPLSGFDNYQPFAQFIQALIKDNDDLIIDKDHTIVISPDEGALDRAIFFATVMGVDTGMFYKRRDYSVIVNGKNPIVAHQFLGSNIEGKDIIIIDDMISSGESMLDTARQLKGMGANRVFICCTFGLFTNGLECFDKAYEAGHFDRVITTNLTYLPPELYTKKYFACADMYEFTANIIDFMNHSVSMTHVIEPAENIRALLAEHNKARENKNK